MPSKEATGTLKKKCGAETAQCPGRHPVSNVTFIIVTLTPECRPGQGETLSRRGVGHAMSNAKQVTCHEAGIKRAVSKCRAKRLACNVL